jgi:hypothetical protein
MWYASPVTPAAMNTQLMIVTDTGRLFMK